MKVGIVIPSYNQGCFIGKAIESVLRCRKHIAIDIAVVDGGSTDETADVIRKYASQLQYWCSEPDGGQADAINKGIAALPDCDYYMWLNSDDEYDHETAVAAIAHFAQDKGYEVCYGRSYFMDAESRKTGEYPVEPYDYDKLGEKCYLSQPSVLFSRKAYEQTGPINKDLKMCLDYEYWIRLGQKFPFGFIEEYIGNTRMYEATKTATMQGRHLEEAISILEKYYGRVPMPWIVTKFLADHPDSFWQKIPTRVLLVLCLPLRNKMIKKITGRQSDV